MGIRNLFSLSRENVSVIPEEAKAPSSGEVIEEKALDSTTPPTVTTEVTVPEADLASTSPATTSQSEDPATKSPKLSRFGPLRQKKDLKPNSLPSPALSSSQQPTKKLKAFFSKGLLNTGNADKQAKQHALFLRTLIIGPSTFNPNDTPAYPKSLLEKVKSELSKPDSANKIIAQLRVLPLVDANVESGDANTASVPSQYTKPQGPIHAICLRHNEPQAQRLHFSALTEEPSNSTDSDAPVEPPPPTKLPWFTIADAPDFDFTRPKLIEVFNSMDFIDLLAPPDPDSDGVDLVTVQGALPDHSKIYPPTDRISALTYWWGYEVVLPPPTLKFLSKVASICGTVMKFLTALALVSGAIGEILPFVRYIAQFIDWQFTEIQAQDQGKGVVCSATWILPVSLAPRPWDFPDPPSPAPTQPTPGRDDSGTGTPPTTTNPGEPTTPGTPTLPTPTDPTEPGQPGNPSSPTPVPADPADPEPSHPGHHDHGPIPIPNTPVTSG